MNKFNKYSSFYPIGEHCEANRCMIRLKIHKAVCSKFHSQPHSCLSRQQIKMFFFTPAFYHRYPSIKNHILLPQGMIHDTLSLEHLQKERYQPMYHQ